MSWLIVGLGNPGAQYERTRHNVGFMFVDALAARFGDGRYSSKFSGYYSKIAIDGRGVFLLKPQTYMNLSGKSVLPALMFYKLKPHNILVVHDDLDLQFGRVKVKVGGSSGGHNGLKSIDNEIGQGYHRLRVGIGAETRPFDAADYVLQRFSNFELEKANDLMHNMVDHIGLLLDGQSDNFLNKLSVVVQE